MAEIVILGAGRLGTSLGRALASRGHAVKALTARHLSSAAESRKIIGQGLASTDNSAAARRGDILFLCLPDEEIPKAARGLARSGIDWSKKFVFHTSGLLPAEALSPLKQKGALTASFHPVQSFPAKKTPASQFRGIYFGLEGDRPALTLARRFIRELGGKPLVISGPAKPLYHAAFVIASNFSVVLVHEAVALLRDSGIGEAKALRLLFPLLQGTLRNVKKLDISGSLTGPVVRGDMASIREHLRILGPRPRLGRVYREVSLLALELAKKKGLAANKVTALRRLLEDR
jgi:predicted short-subunit dehydrogenase-like oxidoreductase (DUF2520 family)